MVSPLVSRPIVFFLALVASAVTVTGAQIPYESGELKLALKKLEVLGSVLYISAHPDDENTAFLATMAKRRLMRTGNLSLTRGEGGQNLIGPEQGDALGLIRTQELLGARGFDGAEQFFSGAIDFGYSKSTDETLRFWGKEETLADIVWIIRKFRPDVIVTRFTPERGGHGNHTASAVLAYEGFRAAGDSTRFPEQLGVVRPWKAKRLVWNTFGFAGFGTDTAGTSFVSEDLGSYSPLLGLSLGELAGKGRSMHKSQGFGASELRGSLPQYFVHVDGEQAKSTLFDGIETTWKRIPGSDAVWRLLTTAVREFLPEHPSSVLPTLLEARRLMKTLGHDPWLDVKREEIEKVIIACAGLRLDANAAVPQAVPGASVPVTVIMLNRSAVPCVVRNVALSFTARDTLVLRPLAENVPSEVRLTMQIPQDAEFSEPYWLVGEKRNARYTANGPLHTGLPENPPVARARITLDIGGQPLTVETPVRYRWVDPTGGELYRPFLIMPPVSVTLNNAVILYGNMPPREVVVLLKNTVSNIDGTVRLTLPNGWRSDPAMLTFAFDSTIAEKTFRFTLHATEGAVGGEVVGTAVVGGRVYDQTLITVAYPHIAPQSYLAPARAWLVRLDIQVPTMRIGYINGAGDGVPAALSMIGYQVDQVTDDDLETGDLKRFDAIVAGIRAYNTNPKLRAAHDRLMDYVRHGGRYIIQYITRPRSESFPIGPYPLQLTQNRVSVEDAPVRFLIPDHPLLTSPNLMTDRDFDGWVQERGLYFADDTSPDYTMPLSSNDPGEPPHRGGLLYARYGAGYVVYTGFSFFRQLPAGVPGAFRLFVNLLSQKVGQ